MTTAIIAVALDADRMLASTVTAGGGAELHGLLTRHYADQTLAGDLVALGDLLEVGPTVPTCRVVEDGEGPIALAGDWELECHRLQTAHHLHVFENGKWRHEVDPWEPMDEDEDHVPDGEKP